MGAMRVGRAKCYEIDGSIVLGDAFLEVAARGNALHRALVATRVLHMMNQDDPATSDFWFRQMSVEELCHASPVIGKLGRALNMMGWGDDSTGLWVHVVPRHSAALHVTIRTARRTRSAEKQDSGLAVSLSDDLRDILQSLEAMKNGHYH